MQVADDVYEYKLEWPKCVKYAGSPEALGLVVVESTEATVLFGSGDETTADELIPIARDHDVDVVLVEHGDPDHYEGVPYLREALDVEVAVPVGDAGTLEEEGIRPDRLLDPGEVYWGIETIDAPGHTPGNMAYLYEDTLVAADTVFGRDSVYALEYDWSGPLAVVTSDWNSDDAQMRESAMRLVDYEYDDVLVTHGTSVLGGGKEAVEKLKGDLEAQAD